MTPVRIVDGRYDLWLQESATLNEDTRFFSPSEETTLTVPSAAGKVITVGAYNSRTDAYADFQGEVIQELTIISSRILWHPG